LKILNFNLHLPCCIGGCILYKRISTLNALTAKIRIMTTEYLFIMLSPL
jgi:hypothetical protein